MAVKLRLMRMGKKKQPTYRVVAADSRSPRNGRFIEILGTYEPRAEPSVIKIDADKAVAWLNKGAQPTERVEKLLEDAQIKLSTVASDIFGVSGRAMLAELRHGLRDRTVVLVTHNPDDTAADAVKLGSRKCSIAFDTGQRPGSLFVPIGLPLRKTCARRRTWPRPAGWARCWPARACSAPSASTGWSRRPATST